MKNIKKNIEQLETAGELLDKDSPTTARLSLFLLDNLAELLMYNFARIELLKEDWIAGSMRAQPRYSTKKGSNVLRDFEDKVNFLVQNVGKLDSLQDIILKVGHRLRNEAYHNGILRESIIIPVVHVYFQTVCELMPTLWTGIYDFTDHTEVENFLKKYGQDSVLINRDNLGGICRTILKGRECDVSELARAVSNDLVSRIEETIEMIEGLASDQKRSPEDVLKYIQFSEETDLEFGGKAESHEEWLEFQREIEVRLAAFRPKVTLRKLQTWKKQAGKITSETSPGKILARFNQIDKPFVEKEKIEDLVAEAVIKYEEHLGL